MDTGIHTPSFLSRDDAVMGRIDLLSLMGRQGTPTAYGAQNFRDGQRIAAAGSATNDANENAQQKTQVQPVSKI